MKYATGPHSPPSYLCREIHALDALVDDFANHMKLKLRKKFLAGRYGWDDANWTIEDIRSDLIQEAGNDEADPVDVANYAAFLWNRLP